MLVSHLRDFIFLKTVKTAGTSVEIYLEPLCRDDGREPTHECVEHVCSAGIVGARGATAQSFRYYNHMTGMMVKEAVGDQIWSRYTKVACVRDPFDKVVSAFWMANRYSPQEPTLLRASFRSFVLLGAPPVDRAIYTDDNGKLVCDIFLRYETLIGDLRAFCALKGIGFEQERLGRFKAHHRPHQIPLVAYYDRQTLEWVRQAFSPEFDWFGYERFPAWADARVGDGEPLRCSER